MDFTTLISSAQQKLVGKTLAGVTLDEDQAEYIMSYRLAIAADGPVDLGDEIADTYSVGEVLGFDSDYDEDNDDEPTWDQDELVSLVDQAITEALGTQVV